MPGYGKKNNDEPQNTVNRTFTPADYERKQFIYNKTDLLIPNPKEDPEAYKKALGNRAKKEMVN